VVHPGKNFPGQKGFPTPNNTPDDTVRRVFIVPNSEEWLGLLEGAVQVLLDEWRYFDWGELTPAEAAAAFNTIILASYTNVCPYVPNSVPRIIRLNPDTGAVEEVGEDGEWTPSTGDYAVPAVPPREDADPVCLAAENAANVLAVLYEDLSDYWQDELSYVEAATNFVLEVAAIIAAPFGLIGEALVAMTALVFRVAYEFLEFVTADLWTSDFTKNLVCILVDCASNVDGVVTFDYNCFNEKLAAQTNIFTLTAEQLRLFGQIQYILSLIGGADALNSAGATTAITVADCGDCSSSWCRTLDFTAHEGVVTPYLGGDWADGVGWQATDETASNSYRIAEFWLSLPSTVTIYRAEIVVEMHKGSSAFDADALGLCAGENVGDFTYCADTFASDVDDSPPNPTQGLDIGLPDGAVIGALFLEAVSSTNTSPVWYGSATILRVSVWGEADAPDWSASGWDEC